MSVRAFFVSAERELRLLARHRVLAAFPAVAVLEMALEQAMMARGRRTAFRLRRGEGGKVRARLLTAAGRLGLTDPTMQSGETIAAWLRRGLQKLDHARLFALLREAARERGIGPAELEARAP